MRAFGARREKQPFCVPRQRADRRKRSRHFGISHATWKLSPDHRAMPQVGQQFIGLSFIIVNTAAVAPAIRREIQRHDVIRFAVGRDEFAHGLAVCFRLPRKKSKRRMRRRIVIQISFRPVPKRVELRFFVHLHRDHHAVGQTFRAHVVMLDVRDVGERAVGICAGGK